MKKLIAAALALCLAATSASGAAKNVSPKLIILISIDQFSADLFNEYRGEFREGLATLEKGIVYANAYHAHGLTETCAGHATIASGRHPSASGIVANQWYDRREEVGRYCTDDGIHVAARSERKAGIGPGLLGVSTLGDWLKAASPGSRVFSVAGKDRSAIMMGGHHPDGAYWFDGKLGFDSWGDDIAQAQRRLSPLSTLNVALARRVAKGGFNWAYYRASCKSREAQVPLADKKVSQPRLPHTAPDMVPGQSASRATLPPWFYDEVTVDAALSLVDGQALGRSASADLLTVGLSATDMVGHAYGTQGPEMCDQMARVDKQVGRLLKRVTDMNIPVLVALTADHGGGDIPERLAARGYRRAGRIDSGALLAGLNGAVRAEVRIDWNPLRLAMFDPTQIVIVDAEGRLLGDVTLRERIAQTAVARAPLLPHIVGAWTAGELMAHKVDLRISPDMLSITDRMALSYFPNRGGDIFIAMEPLKIAAPPLPGLLMMGHSGPSDFNRRVPMIFWWPGIANQERALPVKVVDLAPTLAAAIGILPSNPVDGECLALPDNMARCGTIKRMAGNGRRF